MKTKIIIKLQNMPQFICSIISRFSCLMLLFSFFLTVSLLMFSYNSFSQSVGIGAATFTPDASAILDVNSTTQGTLITRMTTLQRDAINSPAEGLIIYNLDCHSFNYNAGTPSSPNWQPVNSASSIPTPVSISGITSVCGNQSGVLYSVSAISEATSYKWTLPVGATISSGNGTNTITVTFGTNEGNICIIAQNNCGVSNSICTPVSIIPNVSIPVFSLGSTSNRCQGSGTVIYGATASNSTGITYSLDATSLTGGNTIVAGTGVVTYATGWSGTTVITASAEGCNGPATAIHTVTVKPNPTATATSNNPVCGATLTLTGGVSSMTSYIWSGPNSYSSSSQSPTVSSSVTSAMAGTYTLTVTNNGCTSTASTLVTVSNCCTPGSVSDGTLTKTTSCDGNYTVIKWTYSSSPGSTTWNVPSGVTQLEYLVVGGGGGGGSNHGGGGGGAGGLRTNYGGTPFTVTPGASLSVFVGKGGTGGNAVGAGALSGDNSSFSTITGAGGGRGGGSDCGAAPGYLAYNGGSGGGANPWNGNIFGYGNTPSTSPVQGYNGGTGDYSWIGTGGGGGGAGGAGGNSTSGTGGTGGVGLSNSITGTAIFYAGGGGGGYRCDGGSGGIGGNGGGGSGLSNPTSGEDGKGGGGGGAGYYCATRIAGNGGSGVVIIRYQTP